MKTIEQEGIKIEGKVVNETDRAMVIEISGYVDQANCHLLQKTINSCLKDGYYNLVFNLKKLVYMSSAGWGVLIGEIKRFRENNGDLKLANMGPEIYEIYQMLEFYHIISEYPSVEDALKSLNTNLEASMGDKGAKKHSEAAKSEQSSQQTKKGVDIEDEEPDDADEENPEIRKFLDDPEYSGDTPDKNKKVVLDEEIDINIDGILANEGISKSGKKSDKSNYVEFDTQKYSRKIDTKVMPIPDKIRDIIANNPHFGLLNIKKALRKPEYGEVKIGYFKLKALLKNLDLDTKEKRFRYFRSA